MDPRFVTKSMHAFLDYPVAISLMIVPFVIGLGSSNPLALWLAVSTGVAAFILTVYTDHKLGVFRVLPYSVHLAVDFVVGLVFLFLFHWAHRFRYALVDLGLGRIGSKAWLFYGTAIVGTVLAGIAALRL